MEITTIILIPTLILLFLVSALVIYFWVKNKSISTENNSSKGIDQLTHTVTGINQIIQKLSEQVIELKTNTINSRTGIEHLRDNFQKMNTEQSYNKESLNKIKTELDKLNIETSNYKIRAESLTQKINEVNEIFTSSYQKGEMGETSLKYILEHIITNDPDVIYEQYTLKNGKRPDFFLKTDKIGIPIDSKFPYDNFSRILKLKKTDDSYEKELKKLLSYLRKHIDDVSKKYLSPPDKVDQVVIFIPSQPLFDFIHQQKIFVSVRKLAMHKKVLLTSPANIPAMIRLILVFQNDQRRTKYINDILKRLKILTDNFGRWDQRWDKLVRRITALSNDIELFDKSTKKISNDFKNIRDFKEVQKLNSNKNIKLKPSKDK